MKSTGYSYLNGGAGGLDPGRTGNDRIDGQGGHYERYRYSFSSPASDKEIANGQVPFNVEIIAGKYWVADEKYDFYGCDIRIIPDVGKGSYFAGAINISQDMWDRYKKKGLNSFEGRFMMHEYGHYLQNKYEGSIKYNLYIAPSSLFDNLTSNVKEHSEHWTEIQASTYAFYYFGYPDGFVEENNPINPFSINFEVSLGIYNQYLNYHP